MISSPTVTLASLASIPGLTADRPARMFGRGDRIFEFTRYRSLNGEQYLDVMVDLDSGETELVVDRLHPGLGRLRTQFATSELAAVVRSMTRRPRVTSPTE